MPGGCGIKSDAKEEKAMKLLKEFTQYNYPIVHKAFEMIVEEKL